MIKKKRLIQKLNKIQKWDYKVVTTDSLLQEPQNHDIAVSQEASNERKEYSKDSIDGWELISVLGEFCIFKKSNI